MKLQKQIYFQYSKELVNLVTLIFPLCSFSHPGTHTYTLTHTTFAFTDILIVTVKIILLHKSQP